MKKVLTLLTLLMAFAINGFAQDTWTVAGTAAALNGTQDWAPANADNDMTLTDGLWTLNVKGATLEKGVTYEYKVVKNHAWGEEYPNSNKKFSVDETASYDIVYTFNEETKDVTETVTKAGEAGPVTHVYSIAGSPESVFGAAWSETATATEMTLTDGLYTWTSEEVELEANTAIAFKVVVDHSWGVAYPASDYKLNIEAAGKYTITITFNEETKEVKATATKAETTEPEPEPQPVVISSMAIVGELTGGWPTEEDWSMAKAMTKSTDDADIWTLTIEGFEAEAKAYKYKATANGKWGDYELPAEGDQTYTFEEAGKYNLTFTANTKEHALTLTATKVETTEPEPEPQPVVINSMAIVGDLTGGWPIQNTETKEWDWSMAKAMTKSTDDADIWTLTIEGFEAEAKAYKYKATANGKWGDYELPAEGDQTYTFEEAGKYNLTFTANTKDNTLTLTATKVETTEPEPEPQPVVINSMAIVGELTGGWPTGEDWSTAKAMTKSTEDADIWTLTIEGFEAEAKKYEYKATANGKWGDYELPAEGNQTYTFEEAGKYNLTFTANTKEHTLTLTATKVETTEPEPEPQPVVINSMAIVGDLTGGWPIQNAETKEWDWSMAKAMTKSTEDADIWTLTIEGFEAEAKAYKYKATANGKWGDYELPAEGNQTYTFEEAGKYNLTFTANTKEHTLTLTATKVETTEPEPEPQPVVINSMAIVGDLTGGWPIQNTETKEWDWSMAKAMTKSTEDADIWTLTIEGFEAEAKKYEYKATANSKWGDYELPAEGNQTYTFEEAGKYNLTFTANTKEHTLTLTATKVETTEPEPEPQPVVINSMAIVGELTGGWPIQNAETEEWDWSMAKAMTQDAENANIWKLTVKGFEAEAKKYEYKATANGKWGDYELPAVGNADFVFGTEEYPAGIYTLTFTVNTEENTLTLDAVMREKPVYADNNIYFWESPDGIVNENGGTAVHNNGTRVNYSNAGHYTICLNGKADYSTDFITITLNEGNALKAGDVIAITAYRNKDATGKKSAAKITFKGEKETSINSGDGFEFVNINEAVKESSEYGEAPNTVLLTVPADADGCTEFLMTRAQTGTNLFITKLDIYRPDTYTVVGDVALTGAEWAVDAANNDMVKNDETGLYEWKTSDIDIVDGTELGFKVVKNHSYEAGEWPANNWIIKLGATDQIAEAGKYNITITFNPADGAINVIGERTGEPTGIATIKALQENGTAVYNLNGQRINVAGKGLYIVNGRKVVVK